MPVDVALLRPVLRGFAGGLWAAVAADDLRATQLLTQSLQHALDVVPAKPRRDFDAQTLPRAVVNHV